MAQGPDTDINSRAPPMLHSSWEDDCSQKITQGPDGTVHRVCTVDGKEVKQEFHSSGSFKEWRSDGSTHTFDAKNGHTYSKGGATTSVDNHGDVKMSGHSRISIDTDGHVEFNKNASIAVNGVCDIACPKGHIKMSASEINMSSTQGSISMAAARDFEMKTTKGRFAIATQGVHTTQTGSGDHHISAGGKMDWTSGSDAKFMVGGDYIKEAKGNATRTVGGSATYQAGSSSTVKAGSTLQHVAGEKVQLGETPLVLFKADTINHGKPQVGPTDPVFA
jgi:hypothetical protein